MLGRVERLAADNDENLKLWSELLTEVLSLSSDLEDKLEHFKKLCNQNLPTDPTLLESMNLASASTPVRQHETEVVADNVTVPQNTSTSVNKCLRDIEKLGVKFSGDVSKLSVNAFLIQIEEFCTARNTKKSVISCGC